MNILSLYNGVSGLHLSFERAGIKVDKCFYSEIDKYANQITEKNYPEDIALGDVLNFKNWSIDWSSIDFVAAGFPCQPWSVSGDQLGVEDDRGKLFWITLEIIKKVLDSNNNAKFLMENVKMKKEFEEYITKETIDKLGYVEKTMIDSSLVSAQKRERYYWTNFKIGNIPSKDVVLKDVLDYPLKDKYKLSGAAYERFVELDKKNSNQIGTTARPGKIGQRDRVYSIEHKMITLTATMYKQPPQYGFKENGEYVLMKLSPLECERLQTLPDNWTAGISDTQRYKSIGNGWTIDVISEILKNIK